MVSAMTLTEQGCTVCGPGTERTECTVDEGMFRTGESFTYFECGRCGSLQIASVPEDLGKYYDTDEYYSFKDHSKGMDRGWLRLWPARAALRANTVLYLRTGRGRGVPWTRAAGLRVDDRILDFGCGAGDNLLKMHLYGFTHLEGADPFLPEDVDVAPGVHLRKKTHIDLEGQHDWVVMHHSFEHLPDPHEMLRSARRVLAPNGRILIRMPIMGRAAWRQYGVNWAQIDPPRHLVLYTPEGIKALAEAEGFRVVKMFYDSTAFQFWGSECVAAGKPHSAGVGAFTEAQIAGWTAEARRLNTAHDGDQAGIVLGEA